MFAIPSHLLSKQTNKKTTNNQHCKDVKKREPLCPAGKTRTTIVSSKSTFGYLSRDNKTLAQNDIYVPVQCSVIHNSQAMGTTYLPINGRKDKENVIHTHTYTHTHSELLFSHKKKGILLFVTTWMNLRVLR